MLFMYTAWIIVSRAINSKITGNFHKDLQYWTEYALLVIKKKIMSNILVIMKSARYYPINNDNKNLMRLTAESNACVSK